MPYIIQLSSYVGVQRFACVVRLSVIGGGVNGRLPNKERPVHQNWIVNQRYIHSAFVIWNMIWHLHRWRCDADDALP
jgi:hypothetical protein